MYALVAGGFRGRFEQSYHPYHMLIADAFLHGQTHVRPELIERRAASITPLVRERLARIEAASGQALPESERARLISQGVRDITDLDWTIVDGRYYGYWSPLLPTATVPVVALFGPEASDRLMAAIVGALNVALVYWLLRRVDRAGFFPIEKTCALGLTVLFAFGTVHFYMSCWGTVWFAAQQIALTAFVMAMILVFSNTTSTASWLGAGTFFGFAILGRAILILAVGFFIVIAFSRFASASAQGLSSALRRLAAFMIPVVLAVGVHAAYNVARFGDARDSGYGSMMQRRTSVDRERFVRYGAFDVRCFPRNAWYYFLNPRLPKDHAGRIWFDQEGNSMFLVTPPLLWMFAAWRARSRLTWALVAGIVPVMAALLVFFTTGPVQFGNRFLLEVMPLLLLLTAIGMRGHLSRAGYVAIVLAIAANLFGVYRFCHELCDSIRPFVSSATLPAFVIVALVGGWVASSIVKRRASSAASVRAA